MKILTAIALVAICAVQVCAAETSTGATEVPVSSLSTGPLKSISTQGQNQAKPSAKNADFYGTNAPQTAAKPAGNGKSTPSDSKGKKGNQVDDGKESDSEKKDIALPMASQDGVGEQSVMPEVQMKAMLSASDVNRVVCGTDIKDVTFSKEKGVMVKYSGKNAFVKFAVTKQGEKTLYAVNPVELFVICGDSVFNIIAIPKRIPSQTIRLNTGKMEKIQKNNAVHAGQSFEKKLLEIIKSTYTDELPESYTIIQKSQEIKAFRDATVMHKRDIAIEGEGLIVHEYYVSLKDGVEQLAVSERDFMKKEFANRVVAISVDPPTLHKGETSRVFVVDAKEADNVERP